MIKLAVPQGSVLGPALLVLCINDLPAVINQKAIPVLFADNTSILFTRSDLMEFHMNIETVLGNVNMWFKKNFLSLTFWRRNYFFNFSTLCI